MKIRIVRVSTHILGFGEVEKKTEICFTSCDQHFTSSLWNGKHLKNVTQNKYNQNQNRNQKKKQRRIARMCDKPSSSDITLIAVQSDRLIQGGPILMLYNVNTYASIIVRRQRWEQLTIFNTTKNQNKINCKPNKCLRKNVKIII